MESETLQMIRATKRAEWESWLESWKRSGLSVAKFCQTHQLKEYTFRYWQSRLNPPSPPEATTNQACSGFVEATYRDASHTAVSSLEPVEIQITLREGFHLHLKGPGVVTQLRGVLLSLQGLL